MSRLDLDLNQPDVSRSRLDVVKALSYCVLDLSRLDRIDASKIEYKDHKVLYEILADLKNRNFKGFNNFEAFGLAVGSEKGDNIMWLRPAFALIDDINFNVVLEESGIGVTVDKQLNRFVPWSETLADKRAHVLETIRAQFVVEGFPLPIVRGKLNSIVAPSHAGKTIYSLGLAITLARAGHKVVFLSTEEDEESAVEKTMGINANDPAFARIDFRYCASFNKETLELAVRRIASSGAEFLIIDYLKKSMWDNYVGGDHVVMEEINSTLLKAMAADGKISVFAFVQGNREAFKSDLDNLIEDTSKVALLIDGGLPVYRSADNLMFIKKSGDKRYLLVAKSRRNPELLGVNYEYNVNLVNFNITMNKVNETLFPGIKKVGSK